MARRKKAENETPDQLIERQLLETIANHANRSEKNAWNLKFSNMQKLIKEIAPIEEKILNIIHDEKQPILDKVAVLRKKMVDECIHPYEYLVNHEDHVECKFCNCKISVSNAKTI